MWQINWDWKLTPTEEAPSYWEMATVGVPIRSQCTVPITIGKYSCEVPALIMDVDWGSSQHLVLGSDWITQHHAMLGARAGQGPQLDIRGQSGREKHTIFAKKVGRPKENRPPEALGKSHHISTEVCCHVGKQTGSDRGGLTLGCSGF